MKKSVEFFRYFLVCVAATAVSFSVRVGLNAAIWSGETPGFARGFLLGAFGWAAAVLVSWAGCRWFAYRGDTNPWASELAAFVSVRFGTMLVEGALMGFFTGVFGLSAGLASLLTVGPVFVLNYAFSSKIVGVGR